MSNMDFEYRKPETLEEACRILEEYENAAPIAGGTDVLVELEKGLRHNNYLVSLSKINELKIIKETSDKLIIGAAVTHNEIKKSPIIKEKYPALFETASVIGTEQIRNTATVGGNLCTGASCCDMAPVLLAMNADVEIANSKERRIVLLKDFFIFHKETSLKKGEIMTRIMVPLSEKKSGIGFEKFGLRDAASISVASVAAFLKIENKKLSESRIVIGAVAPVPKISEKASRILLGSTSSDIIEQSALLEEVANAAAADSLPLDDIRGTAEFRRNLVKVLTKRVILKAIKRAINN